MKNALTAGTVTLTLSGTSHEMACTPGAAVKISRRLGGLSQAITRAGALDLDAIGAIVCAAIGREPKQEEATIEEVFGAGADAVGAACVRYVGLLMNAGKAPGEGETDGGTEGNG